MRLLFLLGIWILVFLVGCGGGEPELSELLGSGDVRATGSGFGVMGQEEAGVQSIPLTKQAAELRRVRDEHVRLIKSIPPTLGATATLTPEERQDAVVARVVAHPDGIPVPPRVDEDWFDFEVGLRFYRDGGGDWTARRVRESHTHRNLFFYSEYPDGIANFGDGSILEALAREIVFEAVGVLPLLGEPTPAMVDLFSRRLGWELRESSRPVVNVWTTFVVSEGDEFHRYAIGGVMLMGVGSVGEGEDLLEYVVPGRWLGPVVVERLG